MNLNICYSHFSLANSHADSIKTLMLYFEDITKFNDSIRYKNVNFYVATDFLVMDYYGPSIQNQIENLSLIDRQLQSTILSLFYQKWFHNASFSHTTEQLVALSQLDKNRLSTEWFVSYSPTLKFKGLSNIIKNIHDLNDKYDYLLSNYPIDKDNWFSRAKSRFNNLIFHDNCRNTMDKTSGDFCSFTKSFTTCLKVLDNYSPTLEKSTSKSIKLIDSSSKYECTEQGSSDEKFKFSFTFNGREIPKLNCEYHLKPNDSNFKGDRKHYHNRLYFGFFPTSDLTSHIAIASLGPHI